VADFIRLPTRSVGLKFLLVCVLALVMAIPTSAVWLVLQDRLNRYNEVRSEISRYEGGMQTVLGPVLLVPYSKQVENITNEGKREIVTLRGESVVFPETGDVDAKLAAEERRRAIYTIPTFKAEISVKARFDPAQAAAALEALEPAAAYDWPKARLAMGVSNTIGLLSDVALTLPNGEKRGLKPMSVSGASAGAAPGAGNAGPFALAAAPAGDLLAPRTPLDVKTAFELSGAERFSVASFAKDTTARVAAQWPHPSFEGGFLPTRREISAAGFSAEWNAPLVRRGIPEVGGDASILADTASKDFAVSLTEPTNIYTGVNRALKYSLMFIGLVFVAYFMFEIVSGARAHPAQYVMVGLAQAIFYLLLLAFAERAGFTIAFAIAAAATVSLISLYVQVVFKSRKFVAPAFFTFALVYALMYVLMQAEDYSLLVGALMSFAALAALMYLTRNVAWYGAADAAEKGAPPA
jgi:inner membrane protein